MYANKLGGMVSAPAAGSLTAAANIHKFMALAKVQVKRYAFVVTTAVVSTGNVVLAIYKRKSPGQAAGQVQVGTISIPNGAAVGDVYYEDFSDAGNLVASLQPGESIECDVSTAAAGGGAAGQGIFVPEEIEESPEIVANLSNHIKG